eukprot:TRINITY_DN27597_c0_g1_i1.p1 TRINITY_DN27597_c0_g1~~TRINITY_DN27597_c0_g1_i1.p1  ORF type:complete len:215 (+),score=31.10 TRINITY_DN27597_c0_g1_i1:28-645(+)
MERKAMPRMGPLRRRLRGGRPLTVAIGTAAAALTATVARHGWLFAPPPSQRPLDVEEVVSAGFLSAGVVVAGLPHPAVADDGSSSNPVTNALFASIFVLFGIMFGGAILLGVLVPPGTGDYTDDRDKKEKEARMRGWRKNIAEQYGEDALRELDKQVAMAGASSNPYSPGASMAQQTQTATAAAPRGSVILPGVAAMTFCEAVSI